MRLRFFLETLTLCYLWWSAYMDVKERKIYTFYAEILILAWMSAAFFLIRGGGRFLVWTVLIQVILAAVFEHFRLWGTGDTEVFLLGAAVLLGEGLTDDVCGFLFLECLFLITSHICALILGRIEYCIRKRKWDISADLAVVPGFAMSLTSLIVYQWMGR